MIIITPGHCYDLRNLKSKGYTRLQFFQDGKIHGGRDVAGTSCQEVIRALIDRVQVLHKEKPWWGNRFILIFLRKALVLFETRAIEMKIEDEGLEVEDMSVARDGHWKIEDLYGSN